MKHYMNRTSFEEGEEATLGIGAVVGIEHIIKDMCGNIKKSKDLREKEDALDIGRGYTTFYSRIGCFQCSGETEMKDKCIRYYVEGGQNE